jgi:ferredoxin-NADP reductase
MAQMALKVSDIKELTADINMFEFRAEDGSELPPFEAGSHIIVHTGIGLMRSYSLANDPSVHDRYVTAVLHEKSGTGGSKWMHENVKVGDTITATGPINNFPLAEDATEHILLGGGIGITPLMAMGYVLAAKGANFHLHYCTRSPEQTAFLEETKALFGAHMTNYFDGGDPANGIKLDEVFAERPEGAHLYVCGPAGLLNAARKATEHWPSGTVHFELFSSQPSAKEQAEDEGRTDDAFEIELAQSGTTLTVPADKTILDVLIENGIEMVYVCEEGWCGACVVDMLGGEADHRDEVMSASEQAENKKIQTCISRAKPGEKLILDL